MRFSLPPLQRVSFRLKELKPLVVQYFKFGTVGGIATITHIGLFAALIELVDMPPLGANGLAFSLAVFISFFGHSRWTFSKESRRRALPNAFLCFMIVALFGLGLNSAIVYLVIDLMAFHYIFAIMVMVSATPLILFTLNKLWAFR